MFKLLTKKNTGIETNEKRTIRHAKKQTDRRTDTKNKKKYGAQRII